MYTCIYLYMNVQPCIVYHTLLAVFQVSTDVFLKSVYSSVKEIIESGWTQATPEMLFISLALQRYWGVSAFYRINL